MQSNYGNPVVTAERMKFDDLAWERSDNISNAWRDALFDKKVLREVGGFIIKHGKGPAEEPFNPQKGSFNSMFRKKFLDAGSAIIRFPIPGVSMFPEGKVKRERSLVIRFIERHTSVHVPHVLHYGMMDQTPAGLGPFIIMENYSDLVDALNTLRAPKTTILMTNGKLRTRHFSINMNELLQMGHVPPHMLPRTTFKTASAYFLALAEMHVIHLSMQRNDTIESTEDCRRKYIVRCLFRRLARENWLCSHDNGPFKLFYDDSRPANILANSEIDFRVVEAIDWEFTYAAQVESVYSLPSWLLLGRPKYWRGS
ncbi:conserved hypothetical protein [Talaromyces stipitatus ATCC 10500]|uniref:Aminoglycoside phosphotransferase domain-containing protein n=1 Tax=Talaromyces stipitatus (strain ATCC 10500 / CBS 375.48 / QM 6759 / NRRL 1006) TaxID=441959 RepID=B8M2S0_TALSN|nr:uncharacterized protein TSTA_094210 [Talaromyces stipitatus ATCC 10500]EED22175.1 conserved hypothetical protein [Talaromyces stipitatus ATCC 10500]